MSTSHGNQGLSHTDEAQALSPVDAGRKRFATLQAQLALRGFVLRRIDTGEFVVSRWQLFRELVDLDSVERFARLVGAA